MARLARLSLGQLIAPDAADVVDAMIAMSIGVGRDAYVPQQLANIDRVDSRPHLAAIRVPTMIVIGKHDLLTPPALAEELRDAIPGALLRTVAGSGHLPPIEKPDETAALLREWLRMTG